jgi:hypothetical protein
VSSRAYLVQLLLPLYERAGAAIPPELFAQTRQELTDQFGGMTAYMHAPARGLWKTDDGTVARDDIVVFEVMVDELDRDWWDAYRQRLEGRFRQDAIVVRSSKIRKL